MKWSANQLVGLWTRENPTTGKRINSSNCNSKNPSAI